MLRPDAAAAAAGLAPRPLHRADMELMLASLVAQLFVQHHSGELRFVPDDAAPDAGRWSLRTPGDGWHDVSLDRVREDARHLLDGLSSLRWGLAPGCGTATPELADIAEIVAFAGWLFRGFRAGLLREDFVIAVEAQIRQRCLHPELVPVVDAGAGWDGVPPNPGADGWHDLDHRRGPVALRWPPSWRRRTLRRRPRLADARHRPTRSTAPPPRAMTPPEKIL